MYWYPFKNRPVYGLTCLSKQMMANNFTPCFFVFALIETLRLLCLKCWPRRAFRFGRVSLCWAPGLLRLRCSFSLRCKNTLFTQTRPGVNVTVPRGDRSHLRKMLGNAVHLPSFGCVLLVAMACAGTSGSLHHKCSSCLARVLGGLQLRCDHRQPSDPP